MYALGMIASDTGTGTSLAWLLWIVLGVFLLAIAVGWGAGLADSKQEPDAREPILGKGTTRGRNVFRKTAVRAVSTSRRKSKGK